MKTNCDHKSLTDLTLGKGKIRNFYCHQCGFHIYNGREFTKKEWDIYVEVLTENPPTPPVI